MTQNISNQLIEFNDKIFTFLQSKDLDKEVTIQNAKEANGIGDTKNLQAALDEVNNVDRLLRVGIIGRVKAGKSSLLNALIFNGKDILPKAATPMTAALTRMEYSENVRAEVEFYDQADLDQIAENSRLYEQNFETAKKARLAELTQENELLKKERRQSEIMAEGKIKQLAEEYARDEVEKSIELSSAYDQHQRIKQAKVKLSALKAHSEINAQSTEDLMGKLNDYVGSSGQYMPFTKSVKLYIPEEGLKGLEIVDTPGVNDPVQSREERTNTFLAQCDVVLVVSPTGQFLSSEDMELMGRVTTKNGIQEAYIIASQADNQLFGSAKGEETDPRKVIAKVTDTLNAQAQSVFADNQDEMMRKVIELYKKHSVICTSSVAYTMLQNFTQQSQWDENTQHVWSQFKKHYRDFFTDDMTAKVALEELSNIKRIKQILVDVQARKEQIQSEKRQSLISSKINAYKEFVDLIASYIENRIDDIESKNINSERQKLKEFEEQRDDSEDMINTEYYLALRDFSTLENSLIAILDRETKDFNKHNKVEEKERTETYEDWEWDDNALWGGIKSLFGGKREKRYFNRTRTIQEDVINAGQVNQFIREIRDTIANKLSTRNDEFRKEWEDNLVRTIFAGMRQIHSEHQHTERLDRKKINGTIQNVFLNMPRADFSVRDTMPESLKKTGTLKDSSARSFASEAEDYMFEKFKPNIRQDIKNFIENTINTLNKQEVSKLILDKLSKDIAKLIHELENKEESIARYKRMQKDLAILQKEIPNA
ncbi:dynamin family protein [uncultured Aggregatibacter sp.]|uniref:dynamin family protein n=1 Tax=uncultured Aggregatibacter sp. TaxID=470564 RepID=UPI002806233B|nr:dynamin family protein [uncultured Aggregatibacter sp.]